MNLKIFFFALMVFIQIMSVTDATADETTGVIILVHGVGSDQTVYEDFNTKIVEKHMPNVRVIEFDWGQEFFAKASYAVGGRANSVYGMSDDAFAAVAKLKDVIAQCRETLDRSDDTKKVPINILSHSQGTILSLCALQEGARVDNWVLMGSPIGKGVIASGELNTSLRKAASNVSGKVINIYSNEDFWAFSKHGIGEFGLPDRVHGASGELIDNQLGNISNQFVEDVDHFLDESWWTMEWLSPDDPVTDRDWEGPINRSEMESSLSGLTQPKTLTAEQDAALSKLRQFAQAGTRSTTNSSDWGNIFGDSPDDEFEYEFTLTKGMMNGIYFDDKHNATYEVECIQGKVEFHIESATGSEWDQHSKKYELKPSDGVKSGAYKVDNLFFDATVFLRVRAVADGITKVRCKFTAKEKSGVEILDVDSNGKLYARKLTKNEIWYINRHDRSSMRGLIDGEVTNKASKPVLVYGPNPSSRLHDTALYLLRPKQETVEAWDFDGIFVPTDRKLNGESGPYAAKITNGDYGVVKSINSSDYDFSVNLGLAKSDVIKEGEANWLIPRLSQENIQDLADGKRLDVSIKLSDAKVDERVVLQILNVEPDKPVKSKLVGKGKFRVLVSDYDRGITILDKIENAGVEFTLVDKLPLLDEIPGVDAPPQEYSVRIERADGSVVSGGVLAVYKQGMALKHELALLQGGALTFHAQGQSNRSLRAYHPKYRGVRVEDNKAGVTIGRGYDMKHRSKAQILKELELAGVSEEVRERLSASSGLSHVEAAKFCQMNRDLRISQVSQIKLFNQIYSLGTEWSETHGAAAIDASVDSYVEQARKNYGHWTSQSSGDPTNWDSLDGSIRDVLVDFVFQGFTKGPRPMLKGMNNNFDELIYYIENNSTMKRYEPGRQRAAYLRSHRKQKPFQIASLQVTPGHIRNFDSNGSLLVKYGEVGLAATMLNPNGIGDYVLSFRRHISTKKEWTHWERVSSGSAKSKLNEKLFLLPSTKYQIKLEILHSTAADGRASTATIDINTEFARSGDLVPIYLHPSVKSNSPKLRITRIVYGSGAQKREFSVGEDAHTTLNGGATNKPDDDVGYLIKREVNSRFIYYYSPGIASIAIPGDSTSEVGFQGRIGFDVEEESIDKVEGKKIWKPLRPEGDTSPSFTINVKPGASRGISSGWKDNDFSIAAAEIQHRLRYLGKRNNQPAWLKVAGEP